MDEEVTPEEEEKVIEWAAQEFHKYGLDAAAILFLESGKPLAFIGSQIGSMFVMPFLPFLGDSAYINGDKFFKVFQNRANLEKLIKRLENLSEKGLVNEEKGERGEGEKEMEIKTREERKGWRRYIPF
ncbi:hypothetical protein JXL21_09000 [Candidatus Bathyarchaeota archaeon]|nr:hypothetical protein [Candidatus Bathyarchaeota archaeon]